MMGERLLFADLQLLSDQEGGGTEQRIGTVVFARREVGVTHRPPLGTIRPLPEHPSWQICAHRTSPFLLSPPQV